MKKAIKNDKVLFILSVIFFLSVMIFGVTPYLINGGSIWEYSAITRAISIVIGLLLFITVMSYFYFAVTGSIIYSGLSRYVRIIEIITMILVLQYAMPDESTLSIDLRLFILGTSGLVIIICDILIYFLRKNRSNEIVISNEERLKVESLTAITNKKDGEFLLNLCIGLIIYLFWINTKIGNISSYIILVAIILVAINGFLLYKYINLSKQSKKNTQIMTLITLVLSALSISLLEVYIDFFSNDKLLYIIMIIIPTLYLYPMVIKNYYIVTWQSILDEYK